MKQKEINTYDWDSKIFGGLSKNQIRELSKRIFGGNVFTTLKTAIINKDSSITLVINLDNANIDKLENSMGEDYTEILNSKTDTYNFKFQSFETKIVKEDLHDYEPSKISIGTICYIKYVYIILIGRSNHYNITKYKKRNN